MPSRTLAGLYYPFSRCINPVSLKQALLVFDEVTFADPVRDAKWRAHLFRDLEVDHDSRFATFRDVHAAMPDLLSEGCVKRIDPSFVAHDGRMASTLSAISDLSDPNWLRFASNPRKYGMPSIRIGSNQSWQIFSPKLPESFISALQSKTEFQQHLLEEGDESAAWSLSYAAGSAITIALHLDIAEELGLAPVTDSLMHHELLLRKLARASSNGDKPVPMTDDVLKQLSVRIATTVLSQVLTEDALQLATFDQIMAFRDQTTSIRRAFVADVDDRLGQLRAISDAGELILVARQIESQLEKEFRSYQGEFSLASTKVWPAVASSLNTALVSGSLSAVAMNFIGGPGKALLGSIVGAAVAAMKAGLDWHAERARIEKSVAPAVAYLSTVRKKLH
jgi:hypothetical protein